MSAPDRPGRSEATFSTSTAARTEQERARRRGAAVVLREPEGARGGGGARVLHDDDRRLPAGRVEAGERRGRLVRAQPVDVVRAAVGRAAAAAHAHQVPLRLGRRVLPAQGARGAGADRLSRLQHRAGVRRAAAPARRPQHRRSRRRPRPARPRTTVRGGTSSANVRSAGSPAGSESRRTRPCAELGTEAERHRRLLAVHVVRGCRLPALAPGGGGQHHGRERARLHVDVERRAAARRQLLYEAVDVPGRCAAAGPTPTSETPAGSSVVAKMRVAG